VRAPLDPNLSISIVGRMPVYETVRISELRISNFYRVAHGGLDDFLAVVVPAENFADAIFAEGAHAEFACALAQLDGGARSLIHSSGLRRR